MAQSPPRPQVTVLTHQIPLLKLKSGRMSDGRPTETPSDASPISPIRTTRLFTRLQALFPSSISSPSVAASTSSPNTGTPPLLPLLPSPQFIKTRIITWNMHDSLPKGDLEELLGSVPLHTPRSIIDDADRMRLPGLSTDEAHPYHLIVVAGQECPTLSGIPMGLAANFKSKDPKEKEKDREKSKEKDVEKDREKDKAKEKDLLHQTKSILTKHLKNDHTSYSRTPDPIPSDPAFDASSSHGSAQTSGWSAVLEDWFANGVGSLHDVKPVVTGISAAHGDAHSSTAGQRLEGEGSDFRLQRTLDVNWKSYSTPATGSDSSPTSGLQSRTGPYELLVKERLMGIYTAVYVHRDVRPLVRGFSTDAVPAGLIGGRLGNKGGVGVSVKILETTFLFINAHLAAHEGKVPLRVANLAKIKAELSVDSFLSHNDPRTFAEDLTDRFDHTWIFGDLNFRLDISRLHADWLISRKEYAQAFEFDQLQKLMGDGEPTFLGFNEAEIDFPPTFKYDVLRTLKRDKRRSHKGHRNLKGESDGVEEHDGEVKLDEANHGQEDDDGQGEAASLPSSVRKSNYSRYRTDATEDGDESDPSPGSSPGAPVRVGLSRKSTSKFVSHAAWKAKTAWVALLNSSRDLDHTTSSPKKRRVSVALGLPGSSIELSPPVRVTPNASTSSLARPVVRRATSAHALLAQEKQDDDNSCDKGIYDSSSKQRVPSWCDRIIWKTMVEQPEEPDPEHKVGQESVTARSRGRPRRISQLFLQAFRPRPRRDATQPESPTGLLITGLTPRLSEIPMTTSPGLYQTKSLEPLPAGTVMDSSSSPSSAMPCGRRRSASVASANRGRKPRLHSMPVSPRPPHPVQGPRRAESDQLPGSPRDDSAFPPSPALQTARGAPKRWFLNLISRDQPVTSLPPIPLVTAQPSPTPPPQHRKGDVVCLTYRTLDDGQMRRLEGRSDHRPVIGSYAIHI